MEAAAIFSSSHPLLFVLTPFIVLSSVTGRIGRCLVLRILITHSHPSLILPLSNSIFASEDVKGRGTDYILVGTRFSKWIALSGKVDFFLEESGTPFLDLWHRLRLLVARKRCRHVFVQRDGTGPRKDIAYAVRQVQEVEIGRSMAPHGFRRRQVTEDFKDGLSAVQFAAQCRVRLLASTQREMILTHRYLQARNQTPEVANRNYWRYSKAR
jgi:hypothetical protein